MASAQMFQELKVFLLQVLAERTENIFNKSIERLSGQKEEEEEEKESTDLVDIKQRKEIFEKQICTPDVEKEDDDPFEQSEGEPLKMESSIRKPENLMNDLALQAEDYQWGSTLITGTFVENSEFGEKWQDMIMDGKSVLRKSVWFLIKLQEFVSKGKSRYPKDWRKKKKRKKKEELCIV